mmetsp:Transcript_32642/g.39514  ORF Transcript_32642/g.39514 Transcript_32642/m.39514 type:complete len:92 (-) Transcript_32642:54-329(-)
MEMTCNHPEMQILVKELEISTKVSVPYPWALPMFTNPRGNFSNSVEFPCYKRSPQLITTVEVDDQYDIPNYKYCILKGARKRIKRCNISPT